MDGYETVVALCVVILISPIEITEEPSLCGLRKETNNFYGVQKIIFTIAIKEYRT